VITLRHHAHRSTQHPLLVEIERSPIRDSRSDGGSGHSRRPSAGHGPDWRRYRFCKYSANTAWGLPPSPCARARSCIAKPNRNDRLPLATAVGRHGPFLGNEVGPFSGMTSGRAHGNATAIVRAGCDRRNEYSYTPTGRSANGHGRVRALCEEGDVSRPERGLFVVWGVWVIATTGVVAGVHSAQEQNTC
jgi:hypothetical protein